MNKKSFIRGLGIGIFVTALVLGLSYRDKFSDETTIANAKKLGMVFGEKDGNNEKPDATSEPDEAGTAAPEATDIPIDSDNPDASDSPGISENLDDLENPDASENLDDLKNPDDSGKTDASDDDIQKYVFNIERGTWSHKVSEELEELGLIDDADAFDDYLVDNEYARKIKVGEFEIAPGDSYEDIARKITKEKADKSD